MLDDFKQAFNRYNNAHVQIIIINVVIFLALAVLKVFSFIFQAEGFFLLLHHNIAIPASFSDFLSRPWTIVTYAFVHDLSGIRSEEHTSELQSRENLVCRLLLEKKNEKY